MWPVGDRQSFGEVLRMTLETHKSAILNGLRKRGWAREDEEEAWGEIRKAVASVGEMSNGTSRSGKPARQDGERTSRSYDELFRRLDGGETAVSDANNDAYMKEPMGRALGDGTVRIDGGIMEC